MIPLRPALAALTTGLVLAASTIGGGPVQAAGPDTWTVPAQARIALTGHGYGHGHGMSQYGARGAARQGLSWKQIVAFYYPGTQVTRAGGAVRVLITGDTTRDVVVDAQPELRLHRLGGRTTALATLRPKATRWRIMPIGRRTRVDARLEGAKGWRSVVSFPGTAEFSAGRHPLRLHLPGKQAVSYRGRLRSVDKQTVDVVSLEDYLRGVVPAEMPTSWEPQAVRAQAVAARTYAVSERAGATGDDDLCDTSACQVYGGVDAEEPGGDQAVRRTARRILSYQGAPAFAQFSSSDGGWNAVGSQPYLVAQADPYEAGSDNPYATWTATLTDARIEQAYPQLGDLQQVRLGDRDGNGDWGGRVGSVQLRGSLGGLPTTVNVTGDDLRIALGLRSTYFTITGVSSGRG